VRAGPLPPSPSPPHKRSDVVNGMQGPACFGDGPNMATRLRTSGWWCGCSGS
jgi:hypothetical protein